MPETPPTVDLVRVMEAQPHARAVLTPALAPGGSPSHAYLFHGPAGTGKRAVARAFAAALLEQGARSPDTVAERVMRDSHPDLTWVTPSGAAEMLVADIEQPVVAAATRTPFESARRVFVIERADTMNDQAANRMLKTLEEPPAFTHLLLLADRREDVLATIASRCQPVRFDPLPSALIARRLGEAAGAGEGTGAMADERAQACARLALGDADLAARLASDAGEALRMRAEDFVRSALAGDTGRRCGSSCSMWRRRRVSPPASARRRAPSPSSSWCRARSASATSAKPPRRGAAASGASAPPRSISVCAWRSCGCATCCACAKAPPS